MSGFSKDFIKSHAKKHGVSTAELEALKFGSIWTNIEGNWRKLRR